MLEHLGWNTLKERRAVTRLQTLFKILHSKYSLDIPNYYVPQTRHTRYHPLHFIIPNSATVTYQQSFYARTIREWDHLPTEIIEQGYINSFTDKLYYYDRHFFFLGKSAKLPTCLVMINK